MNMELLVNGTNAFPEIVRCIRNARRTIEVNMFIWRNDGVGNMLAGELLDAADRGVSVTLSKDRYGVVLELAEEDRTSFFHRAPSLPEKVKSGFLHAVYDRGRSSAPSAVHHDDGELLRRFLTHPNVRFEEKYKYDHSKFYIFDGSVLILGGINVEDKENGRDCSGRAYRDLMVKIEDTEIADAFVRMRKSPETERSAMFDLNIKHPASGGAYFGMEQRYLDLIARAEKELTVVMAYFSPLPRFTAAILAAAGRGVDVRVLIPREANFQDDTNKRTVSILRKKSGGAIKIFLSPCMVHTKLIMTEKEITFGSANITRKAFRQLDECNLFTASCQDGTSPDLAFSSEVRTAVEQLFSESVPAGNGKIPYGRLAALLEGILV